MREVLSSDGNAELYAGFVTWGTERASRHTRGIEPIVSFRPELQIISVEQLNGTKRLLAERAEAAPRTVSSRYAFSGLLRCVHCGGAMTGKLIRQPRSGRQVRKYVCRRYQDAGTAGCTGQSLQESTVRPIVVRFIRQLFETRWPVSDYLDDAARLLDGGPTEGELRQRLEAELHEVDQAIGRLVEAIADGVIRSSQAKEKNLELLERKDRLQRRLAAAGERATLRAEMADAIALVGRDVGELIEDLDDASFKRLLRLVLVRLSISGVRRGNLFDGEINAYEFTPAFADLLSHSVTPLRRRSADHGDGRAPPTPASAGGPRRSRRATPGRRRAPSRPGSRDRIHASRYPDERPRPSGRRPSAAVRRSAGPATRH